MNKTKKRTCLSLLIRINLFLFGGLFLCLFLLFIIPYIFYPDFRNVANDLFCDARGMYSWRNSIEECQHIGNEIIEALEQYHDIHNEYPEELNLLAPDFMDKIPEQPLGDKGWHYRKSNRSDCFVLDYRPYRRSLTPCGVYYSKTKTWHIDEGSD